MKEKLKVLHIIPSLEKGGAQRLVIDIFNELRQRQDIEIKLVVLYDKNEFHFLTENMEIHLCNSFVKPSILKNSIVQINEFQRLLYEFNPDIIHSHLFEAEILSRWQIIPGIVYITHCHSKMVHLKRVTFKTLFIKEGITNLYEKKILFKKYKQANNNFIAISKDTENYFMRILSKSLKDNIILIQNGIDYNRFYCPPKTSLSKDKIKLITVGNLFENKNHIFLIDVVKILRDKNVYVTLDIIGDGPCLNMIRSKINAAKLDNNIFLIGAVDKVERYLHKSDLYVYSSINEGFGLTIIEAMAAGLPVISLDCSGNRELITNGFNGYILKENNSRLFADKILSLIDNSELYRKMAVNAVEFSKKFDIKEYVNRLLKYYYSLMNQE